MAEPTRDADYEREPYLVPQGWFQSVPVGPVTLYQYRGGVIRVGHRCDRGDRGVVWAAPALDPAHHVRNTRQGPSITPSILCPDCGLHGFVRDGRWTGAAWAVVEKERPIPESMMEGDPDLRDDYERRLNAPIPPSLDPSDPF